MICRTRQHAHMLARICAGTGRFLIGSLNRLHGSSWNREAENARGRCRSEFRRSADLPRRLQQLNSAVVKGAVSGIL